MQEIDGYLKEKSKKKHLQKLLAWKSFYEECNNEWLVKKVQRQIEKL